MIITKDDKELRLGVLAAEVLIMVCNKPKQAYAHAITLALKEKYGTQQTNSLEIGNTLKQLVADGYLESFESQGGRRRIMYRPISKAGLLLGLCGVLTLHRST